MLCLVKQGQNKQLMNLASLRFSARMPNPYAVFPVVRSLVAAKQWDYLVKTLKGINKLSDSSYPIQQKPRHGNKSQSISEAQNLEQK